MDNFSINNKINEVNKDIKIFIAGADGMVGSSMVRIELGLKTY